MAKERLVNTRFWEDGWVRKLNPLDRYLFLYLLTNSHTNIAGIYELPIETIAYESGIDERDIQQTMFPRLEPKLYYKDGWVILTNFPKYQRTNSDKVMAGIRIALDATPKSVKEYAKEKGYGSGIDMIWIPYISHIIYPNTNSNPNSNTNTKKNTNASSVEKLGKKKPFFQGKEMRKSKGKWWVLPKDGSSWLKFDGKESEIEWL